MYRSNGFSFVIVNEIIFYDLDLYVCHTNAIPGLECYIYSRIYCEGLHF